MAAADLSDSGMNVDPEIRLLLLSDTIFFFTTGNGARVRKPATQTPSCRQTVIQVSDSAFQSVCVCASQTLLLHSCGSSACWGDWSCTLFLFRLHPSQMRSCSLHSVPRPQKAQLAQAQFDGLVLVSAAVTESVTIAHIFTRPSTGFC